MQVGAAGESKKLAAAWKVSDIEKTLTAVVRRQRDPSAHSFLTTSFSGGPAKIV